jgi:hypothetical protein
MHARADNGIVCSALRCARAGAARSAAAAAVVAGLISGCTVPNKAAGPKLLPKYSVLPPRPDLPDCLRNTIYEKTETQNLGPLLVSNYSLVVNLDYTGDTTAPTPVREYIIKEMAKRGFGSANTPGMESLTPEKVLADKRVAIVRVDGLIPIGARKGQAFDVQVSALETGNNSTTSLAHGQLYSVALSREGGDVRDPGQEVNILATVADSPIFVNPVYALSAHPTDPAARASLRYGIVMGRARVTQDRSIILRVRNPQYSTSRVIEGRINQRFQDNTVARAFDEGLVQLFVPASFNGDWEHFLGLATHLYLPSSTAFNVAMAKRLAEEAFKPDAKLMDISYAWEGLDKDAMPIIAPLMTCSSPDVAFAAARAAAFIGDPSAQEVLLEMARTKHHPFQINAVKTLGALPSSPAINQMLRSLLDSDEDLVRIEAYKVLAANQDSSVYSRLIPGNDPATAKFILDIVPSSGRPLVYASRRGLPRIAVIGGKPALTSPILFNAFDNTFSIVGRPNDSSVILFYRSHGPVKPIEIPSRPDIAELIARLGGEGPVDQANLDFCYADIVAILQKLSDDQQMMAVASNDDSHLVPTPFILQALPHMDDAIDRAPVIPDQTRPQADAQPLDPLAARTARQ